MYSIRRLVPVLLLAGISCTNPFSTRDVEPPELGSGSDLFEQPFEYDVVLSNLKFSLQQKNISNYMRCFIDSTLSAGQRFRYIPDESLDPVSFLNWSLQDEENYMRSVMNNSTSIGLEYEENGIIFNPLESSVDSVETAPFRYYLTVETDETIVYSGTVRFKLLKNENSLWSIYHWEDSRLADANLETWSVLKATYRWN
jgi:hypothetical protein